MAARPTARLPAPGCVFALLALGVGACRYPSTAVEVTLDTDVPATRTMTLRVAAVRAADAAGAEPQRWDHVWTRGGPGADLTLPASFAVRAPADDARGGVTLRIEAEVAPGGERQPAARLRRVARFAFVPRQTTHLRLFLPLRCADPTEGCERVAPAACTIAARCEEQQLTCGDHGECEAPDVQPAVADAGAPVPDSAAVDAAPAADPGRTLGVYSGPADVRGVRAFETFVGRPLERIGDAVGDVDWTDISQPTWLLDAWGPTRYAVQYAVPMLPNSPADATLAQGAAGAFDTYYEALARLLVARGHGDAVLRLGREVNGDWWPEYAGRDPAAFAAYYRRIVTVMRGVQGGGSLRFAWSVAIASRRFRAEDAWPGDAYVDYVGLNVQDASWAPDTYPIPDGVDEATRRARVENAWNDVHAGDDGLAQWAAFAGAHGKRLIVNGWALTARGDGRGGGDNPRFVEHMAEWLTRNDVAYHVYFDFNPTADQFHELARFPRAAARFRELFGPP